MQEKEDRDLVLELRGKDEKKTARSVYSIVDKVSIQSVRARYATIAPKP
jgi:hypothetical protein